MIRTIGICDTLWVQPHQLRYFIAVAETGSFTSGAQRARVVQSAVSTAIQQLERELGTRLFVRGRGIALTPEGEVLLPRAREVLAAIEAATAAVNATRGRVTGTVNFGMMHRFGTFDMAGMLAAFRRKHPEVVVRGRTSTEGSRGHLDALRRGDLDLALVATPHETLPGLHLRYVDSEALRLVCSTSHPLAKAGTVRLEQVADEVFIDSPAGWGNRSRIDSAFAEAGLQRVVQTETIDFAWTQALVREEFGIAFVPASALLTDTRLTVLDVEPEITHTVRIAWASNRPLSAAAAALAAEFDLSPASSTE